MILRKIENIIKMPMGSLEQVGNVDEMSINKCSKEGYYSINELGSEEEGERSSGLEEML